MDDNKEFEFDERRLTINGFKRLLLIRISRFFEKIVHIHPIETNKIWFLLSIQWSSH